MERWSNTNALAIRQVKALNSLELANSYNNIGLVLRNNGHLLDGACEQYQHGLKIQQVKAPNSLDIAASYNNIGKSCRRREIWTERWSNTNVRW